MAQVAIGVGFLAATAYTLQQFVVPHLLAWLRPGASKAAEEKNMGEVVAAVIQKQAWPLLLSSASLTCCPCMPVYHM
jgi:hypothetical protein